AYARALIEISPDDVLKDDFVIAIPVGKDKGHSLDTIRIKYEWKPPRCSTCLIFDHTDAKCPKLPKEVIPAVVSNVDASHSKDVANDGFEVVKKKRNMKNKHQKQIAGTDKFSKLINFLHRQLHREALSRIRASVSMIWASVDDFVCTRHMLEAIVQRKPVVTRIWLQGCGEACCDITRKVLY
nr:hypothetical protein [Tanacetum cinerariifolium]